MFKNLKSLLLLGLALLLLILIFFVFYVPGDSVEGRVGAINQIFNRKEVADIAFELQDYLSDFKLEERAEIFNKLPFALVKEYPELLIKVFNESYPSWKDLNSFNSNYLMTEVELLEKENASPIKNTEAVTVKVGYGDLNGLGADIKSIFLKVWDIDDRSVYVVDGSLKCEMNISKAETKVVNFEVELFDIKTGYVFQAKYSGDNLVIRPDNKKIEDSGAFELSEKFNVYDYKRLKDYVSAHFKLNFSEYGLFFDDSYIDKKLGLNSNEEGQDSAQSGTHLDVVIYSDVIRQLDLNRDKNMSYAGSMRFKAPIIQNHAGPKEGEEEGGSPVKPEPATQGPEKEISLNIFKADW